MKSIGKRLLSAVISWVLVFSMVLGGTVYTKAASPTAIQGEGEYAVEFASDTTVGRPAEFGTEAADGKVWVNKNVVADYSAHDFAVTLEALCQEYVKTDTSMGAASGPAADVMLILDITQSMSWEMDQNSGSSYKRMKAMIDAVNQAYDTIMQANPKNRIGITVFSNYQATNNYNGGNFANNGNTDMNWLPMDSYTLGSDVKKGTIYDNSNTELKQFIELNSSNNVKLSDALLSGGTASTYKGKTRKSAGSGTYTQWGITTGFQSMIKQVATPKSSTDPERVPYVLILTDGGVTHGNTTWYLDDVGTSSNFSTYARSSTTGTGFIKAGNLTDPASNSGDAEPLAAYTILTAARQKQLLKTAYANYNGWTGDDVQDPTIFTIGLSTAVTGAYVSMLDPGSMISDSSSTSSDGVLSKENLDTYVTRPEDNKYKTSNSNYYIYPTAKEGTSGYYSYITGANVSILNDAFNDLANLVKSKTKEKTSPITTNTSGDPNSNNIEFTDKLGSGMLLSGTPEMGGITGTPDTSVANQTKYTFGDKTSYAIYDTASNELKWTLKAADLPVISYINIDDKSQGFTNPNEPSVKLTYNVKLDTSVPANMSGTKYSNEFTGSGSSIVAGTTVKYTPAGDNMYYYDISVSPAVKKTLETVDKVSGANKTGTASYSSKPSWDENAVDTLLGNNGSERFLSKMEKSVSPEKAGIGDEVTYSVKITDMSGSGISGITVEDPIPAQIENVSDISDSGASASGKVTWTGISVEAGGSKTLTFKGKVKEGTSANVSNTASLTSLNGTDIVGSIPSSTKTLTYLNKGKIEINLDDTPVSGKTVDLYKDGSKIATLTEDPANPGTYLTGTTITGDPIPADSYDIYIDGNPVTKNGANETITIAAGQNNDKTLDFYTLTIKTDEDEGTSNPAGAGLTQPGTDDDVKTGVFLKGSVVEISATVATHYSFDKWDNEDPAESDIPDDDGVVSYTVEKAATLTALAGPTKIDFKMYVNKDDNGWLNSGKTIILKDVSGNEVGRLTDTDGDGEFTGKIKELADGDEIFVFDGTEDTGRTLSFALPTTPGDPIVVTEPIDYYVLVIEHDDGVNEVVGAGTYVKGAFVNISAATKSGFGWKEWEIVSGTVTIPDAATGSIQINGPLTLKAISRQQSSPAPQPAPQRPTPTIEPIPKTGYNGSLMSGIFAILLVIGLIGFSYARIALEGKPKEEK